MTALLVALYVVGYFIAVPFVARCAKREGLLGPYGAGAFFALFWPGLVALAVVVGVGTLVARYARFVDARWLS